MRALVRFVPAFFLIPMGMVTVEELAVPPETCNMRAWDAGAGPVYGCEGTCYQEVGEPKVECTPHEETVDDKTERYCTCGDTQLYPFVERCIHVRVNCPGDDGEAGTWSSKCVVDECPSDCLLIPPPYTARHIVPCNCPWIKREDITRVQCDNSGGTWYRGACWYPN